MASVQDILDKVAVVETEVVDLSAQVDRLIAGQGGGTPQEKIDEAFAAVETLEAHVAEVLVKASA